MANITTTEAANFIPEVWAETSLGALKSYTQMARLVTRNFANEFKSKGDILHIPSRGTLSTNDKTANNAVTKQTPSSSKVDLTLNKHKEVTFVVEDVVEAQANQEVMLGYITDAVIVIAEQMEADLQAEYTNAKNTVGTAGTDITTNTLVSARKTLVDEKVPRNIPVSAILSSKDIAALLNSTALRDASQSGSNAALREGSVGRLAGFDIYESQQVNTTGSSPVTTHNLAFASSAITLAIRPLRLAPSDVGVKQMVIDSGDGFALRMTWGYDKDQLGMQVTLDILYGIVTVRSGAHLVDVNT